jgi:RecJ-like exonuclease
MRRVFAARKPRQLILPWPGTDDACPHCRGQRQVYHRAARDGVEILGGKRITCPVCHGIGSVRAPQQQPRSGGRGRLPIGVGRG